MPEGLQNALPALHAALQSGGVAGLEAEARRRLAAGSPDVAWAAQVMAAAAGAQGERLRALLAGPVPEEAAYRYLAAWAAYWSLGADAAAPYESDARDLPPAWAANLAYLSARRGGGPAELGEPRAPAAWLPDQTLVTVVAQVEGRPARLLADTGAPTTVLSRDFALAAGVAPGSAGRAVQDGAGADGDLRPARAAISLFGGLWRRAPVDLLPLSAGLEIEGILSPQDFLRGWSITFDGVRRELRAGDVAPPSAVLEAPLVWSEGRPYLRGEFEGGHAAWLLLDSGAGASLASPDLAAALGLPVGAERTRSATALSSIEVFAGGSSALRLAGDRFEPIRLLVKTPPTPRAPTFPTLTEGYLGADWFADRQVWISADRRLLRFSPREADGR